MNKNVFKIAIVTAALLTAACKPGVGVGTDQSNTSGTSDDSSIKKSDASTVKRTNARTIKMPAMGIIVQSLREIEPIAIPETPRMNFIRNVLIMNPMKFDGFKEDAAINMVFDEVEKESQKVKKATKYKDYQLPIVQLMDKAIDGDFESRKKIVFTGIAMQFVKEGIKPATGWPISPDDIKMVRLFYILPKAFFVQFTNAFLTELALQIPEQSLSDPSKAHKIIIEKLVAFGPDKMLNLITSTQEKVNQQHNQVVVDRITGRGTSWQASETYYAGGQEGFKVTENGIEYFGNGKLSGQEILVSLDSTLDSSKTITRDINSGSTDSTSNAVKATTEVK